jgi:hypothetical protein
MGGEVASALALCREALNSQNTIALRESLDRIRLALLWASSILPRIAERLSREAFGSYVRKYLFGYDGVRFEDVGEIAPFSYVGETGAQSGVIRAADAGLGIPHSADVTESLNNFLSYAPVPHQLYMTAVADLGVELVRSISKGSGVNASYRGAVSALGQFRTAHLAVVKEFLSGLQSPHPDEGTGGTVYQTWLSSLQQDVTRSLHG